MLPESLDRGLQLGGPLPLQPADHPGGDRQAEQVEGQLPDGPLAEAVGPGQHAEDGPQPGAERPGGHPRRQLRTGGGAASWAGQAMEPVLVHHGADRRHLGDLMPERLGIVTGEGVAAPAALRRLALDDLADCLGRDQGADVTVMSGLAAPLLARGGGRWPSLERGRVGGGRPGGVGGVPAQPLLQLGDPTLDAIEGGGEGGLHIGRDAAPEGFGDRRCGTHVAGIRDGRRSSNSHP